MSTEVELKLTADTQNAERGVGQFSRTYAGLVREISRPLGRVNAFRQLEQTLEQTGRNSQRLRDRVRDLGNEMARTADPSRQLTDSYRQAVNELRKLETAERGQTAQLGAMRRELQGAGVDTRNLANEQARLQRELAQRMGRSERGGALESARRNLGLAAYGEAQSQVAGLQRDLQLLQSTGKLSAAELAIVGGTINGAMATARQGTMGANAAAVTWTESLRNVRGELLAGGIAFGAIGLAGKRSFDQFSGFEQRMAEISTITDLSDAQMSDLAQSVRAVSRDMGEAATGGAAALYDIISAGVDAGDSVRVMEESSKAAIAGLTDTKTAAGIGLAALNAYGDGTDKLGERFDQLFLTVKGGVTTFPELAANLGQVLPIAAAADVSFGEVTASIAAMTKQGLNTATSTTALRGAITALSAPTDVARKKMQELGIEWNGLAGTLQQIADRNLGVDVLREIVPDTNARTAVLALTRNMDGLVESIEAMASAGGTATAAYNKMKDTPEQEIKRFQAAFSDLQISFGQAVAAGLPVVNLITDMLNLFNELPESVRTTLAAIVILGAGGKALSIVIKGLSGPFAALLGTLAATPAVAGPAAASLKGTAAAVGLLSKSIKGLALIGLVSWAGSNVAELGGLYLEMRKLNQSIEDQAKALQATINSNAAYKDALVLSGTEAQSLSEIERGTYLDRLRNAQAYHKAMAEQISRADMERDGPAGRVSAEALAAQRQANAYGAALKSIETVLEAREETQRGHAETIQRIQKGELDATKTELAKQLQAYDDAAAELEKKLKAIEKLRDDSRKRFETLANSFSAPKAQDEPSYAGASSARVQARQALAAGDTEKALELTEKSAKILEQMRDAGQNTYGLAGFAKELGKIADEALKLDATNAQADFDAQKAKVDELVQTAKALEAIQVGYESDGESEEETKARIQALAAEWAKYMQVPVTYIVPDKPDMERVGAALSPGAIPALAGGGRVRGPGTGTSDDVLLWGSNGEFMMKHRAVQHYGTGFMERLNRMQIPRFAQGGSIGGQSLTPSVPMMPPSLAGGAGGQGAGAPVYLTLNGEQYRMQADQDVIGRLHRQARINKLRD